MSPLIGEDGRPSEEGACGEASIFLWGLSEGLREGAEVIEVVEPQKGCFQTQQKAGWYRNFWFL